jgi:hypothetical protein
MTSTPDWRRSSLTCNGNSFVKCASAVQDSVPADREALDPDLKAGRAVRPNGGLRSGDQ